jgi:hypothetical protein
MGRIESTCSTGTYKELGRREKSMKNNFFTGIPYVCDV